MNDILFMKYKEPISYKELSEGVIYIVPDNAKGRKGRFVIEGKMKGKVYAVSVLKKNIKRGVESVGNTLNVVSFLGDKGFQKVKKGEWLPTFSPKEFPIINLRIK